MIANVMTIRVFALRVLALSIFLVSAFISAASSQQENAHEQIVKPFLKQHCIRCHGKGFAEADIDFSTLKHGDKFADDIEAWQSAMEMLIADEMPPVDEDQPSKHEKAKVVAWIKARMQATGTSAEWERKLLFPEYGNLVDHEKLFDGSIKEVAWSPSRLWKRNPEIFNSMLYRGMTLGKGRYGRPPGRLSKIKQPFTIEDKAGIKDYAAIMFADSATLGTMMRNAEAIVDQLTAGAFYQQHVQIHGETPVDQLPKDKRGRPIKPKHAKTAKEFAEIIFEKERPSDSQLDAAISRMFGIMIEREPEPEDYKKYRSAFRTWSPEGGNDEALRMMLIAIAVSPEAIYRSELGHGPVDQHGRQMLSPIDLAYAISYSLTDEKPDAKLMEAVKNGKLKTREDVAREVARIWDDESIPKPRILRFFHEFFGYQNAPKVFKDTPRFGGDYRKVPENLVQDADVLVLHIVNQDRQVLKELLTTEKYFVAHSGDNDKEKQSLAALAKFYAYFKKLKWKEFPYSTPQEHAQYARSINRMFAHPNGNVIKNWMKYLTRCDENGVTPIPRMNQRNFIRAYNLNEKTFDYPAVQPFALAPGKRAGILMHPAWLISHSLNLDNDPVRRGKWIRERLLADTIPELPITVDARIPEAPEQSLRERFAVTREDECWRCHQKMNPLGMPFELYDDFGRYRERFELLHAKGKKKPVDSTGRLSDTGNEQLDGPVEDPIIMLNRLARSERVRQSFVRHAFRYWMGRNEMLTDSSTLISADKAYVENDGSFRALVITLLTSDSFIYRKTIEK